MVPDHTDLSAYFLIFCGICSVADEEYNFSANYFPQSVGPLISRTYATYRKSHDLPQPPSQPREVVSPLMIVSQGVAPPTAWKVLGRRAGHFHVKMLLI